MLIRTIGTGDGKKIILLILFIIVLVGSGVLFVDFVGNFFGVHFPIPGINYLKRLTWEKQVKASENPYMLIQEELSKERERLSLREEQISVRENEVKQIENDAKKKLEAIKQREDELDRKEKMLLSRMNQFDDRQKYIRDQAVKLYNMPPKDAVALLEKQDESDIVDILRAVDSYSNELDRNSIAPYMLKLLGDLNKDKAANVLRKLKYSVGETDTAVETLDDKQIEVPPNP